MGKSKTRRYVPNNNCIKTWEKQYPNIQEIPEDATQTKWISLKKSTFVVGGVEYTGQEYVTRTTKSSDRSKPDAVSMLVYYIDSNGEPVFVLTNQLRPVTHSREISLFAGLCDANDINIKAASKRELEEEYGQVGLRKATPLTCIFNKSAGLSNETEQVWLMEIEAPAKANTQHLEYDEDIQMIELKFSDIEAFHDEMTNYSTSNASKSSFSGVINIALAEVLAYNKYKAFINESIENYTKTNKTDINPDDPIA